MRILRSETGITLVETMASILLFALVVGSILNLAIQNMTMGKRSEFAYTSYNLAKNHLETLRSMPFSNLTQPSNLKVGTKSCVSSMFPRSMKRA